MPRFYPTCLKTRTHFDLLSSSLSYVMLLYPFNERKYLNERNIIITRNKKLDAQRWDTRKLPFSRSCKEKRKIEKSVDPRRKKVDSGDADQTMGLALGMRTGNPCRRDVRRFAKPY